MHLVANMVPIPTDKIEEVLCRKALELAAEARSFGAALLAAFEKGDAEYLASLRATQEHQLHERTLAIRKDQWRDADWQVQALGQARLSAQNQLAYYTTLGAGFLDPSNGTTPGYGPVEFTIVDPQTIDTLRKKLSWLERETIVTYTKAFGQTLGGDHVESNTFEFPITVCRGCLIQFDTDPTQPPVPNCYATAPTGGSGPTVCFFGQDATFDCHFCYSDPYCQCGQSACAAVVLPDAGAPD